MPGVTLYPHQSGDDWAQISSAFATMRSAGRGWVELEQLTSQPFNVKQCVNGTGLFNVDVRIAPGTTIRCDGFTHSAPIFDFSSSSFFGIRGEGELAGMICGVDGASPAGTVRPTCGILIACNGVAGQGRDLKSIRQLVVTGQYTSAAIALISCNDVVWRDLNLFNYNSGAPVWILSSNPDWGIAQQPSPYTSINNQGFVADISVQNVRAHGLGTQDFTGYLRNAQNITFDHYLSDNKKTAHMLAQGYCDSITLHGGKAYSEGAPASGAIMLCDESQHSCVNHWQVGFQNPGNIPRVAGPGNFSGLRL